jgi:hypothetical protein
VSTAVGPAPGAKTLGAEQDAAGRDLLAPENIDPSQTAREWRGRLSTTTRFVDPSPTIQDPAAPPESNTTQQGESRAQAATSMVTRLKGEVTTLPPAPLAPRDRFLALQEWEGMVIERRENALRVRLVDKTRPAAEEEAEINLNEISPQDRGLIKTGAVFYWSIGYHDSASGQRTRQSVIVFRRLPAWTDSEIAAIRRRVRQQKALLGWI